MNVEALTNLAAKTYIKGRTEGDYIAMGQFRACVTIIAMLTGETEYVAGTRIELANQKHI